MDGQTGPDCPDTVADRRTCAERPRIAAGTTCSPLLLAQPALADARTALKASSFFCSIIFAHCFFTAPISRSRFPYLISPPLGAPSKGKRTPSSCLYRFGLKYFSTQWALPGGFFQKGGGGGGGVPQRGWSNASKVFGVTCLAISWSFGQPILRSWSRGIVSGSNVLLISTRS